MTTETAVLLLTAVAGLLTMGFYVQRALQGNIFGTTQSIGLQFDPRDFYREDQHLDMTEEVHQQTGLTMVSADHLPQPVDLPAYHSVSDDRLLACGGGAGVECNRLQRTLKDLPTGHVFREPSFELSEVKANWSSTADSDYRDQR